MSDCLQIQNVEISKCGSYIQSNEDGKLARVENIYKQNKAKQEEPQWCHFPPPSATRSLRQKDSKSNGLYSIVITLAKKRKYAAVPKPTELSAIQASKVEYHTLCRSRLQPQAL